MREADFEVGFYETFTILRECCGLIAEGVPGIGEQLRMASETRLFIVFPRGCELRSKLILTLSADRTRMSTGANTSVGNQNLVRYIDC